METKEREPLTSLVLYRLLKWSIVSPMFRLYFKGKIDGLEKMPKSGPVILVSNHASYFDPPLLGACMNRPVAFMAKEELFKVPLLSQGIKLYGAYPVKRNSGDLAAIRSAITALEQGWAAGIFLEGTRTPDGRIHQPKLGAAMIAAKTQAPLLPVSLWGTEKILSTKSKFPLPVSVTIRVGELIPPPSSTKRQQLETVTEKCATIVNSLHDLGPLL